MHDTLLQPTEALIHKLTQYIGIGKKNAQITGNGYEKQVRNHRINKFPLSVPIIKNNTNMKATSRTFLLEATLYPQKYIKQFLVRFLYT